MKTLDRYILEGWNKTLRQIEWQGSDVAEDGSLWLPHPFTVPCDGDIFVHLFYWDTYFANRGLLLSGMRDAVKGNLRNFIYIGLPFFTLFTLFTLFALFTICKL